MKIGLLILMFSVMSVSVLAGGGDEPVEELVFTISMADFDYTVSSKGGVVEKIELGKSKKTSFHMQASHLDALNFVSEFHLLSWVERVGYLVNVFNVPVEQVFDLERLM